MESLKIRHAAWLPVAAMAAIIYWASSHSIPVPIARIVALSDKLFHAATFAALAIVVAVALRVAHGLNPRTTALWAALAAAAYGASDEGHQLFVPGRVADWFDVAADAAGAALAGLGIYWHLSRRDGRRQENRNHAAPDSVS